MPSCELPENPDLGHLKRQAKALQRAARAGDLEAVALVAEFHPRHATLTAGGGLAGFSRVDALLVVARRYGFSSWPQLLRHMERISEYTRSPQGDDRNEDGGINGFLRRACLTYGDDDVARRDQARAMLSADPGLASANIYTMATTGDTGAAARLLARDPSLARRSGGPHGWEPLLYAAYSRLDTDHADESTTLELAALLLAHGADPNAGYLSNGLYPFTALTGVFGEGERGPIRQPRHRHSTAFARLLLDAGADPNDSQALYNRQFLPDDSHLELLFEYGLGTGSGGPWHARFAANHPSPSELMRDQLEWAAERNFPDRVRLMLENGVHPDVPNAPPGANGSAYLLALRSGNTEIAGMLLAAGANPIALNTTQRLRAALMAGDRATTDQLTGVEPTLANHMKAEEPDLIIRAAEIGRLDAVRLMTEVGFDVNHRHRVTALHEAAGNGDLNLVRLLVELGADPTITDTEHHSTALGWAEYGDQREVVEYLTSRGQ